MAAPDPAEIEWPVWEAGDKLATRKASAGAVQAIAGALEGFLGGSADLAGSNGSLIKGGGDISGEDFSRRNLHFGIREHGMGAVCNGMSLHGGIHPYCATFLVFHNYMRAAVRMAAIMHQPVTFVYTHDSVYLGEDGPTHQPIEHLAAMRAMPNLYVVRPADANETVEAWKLALERRDGPTAICLTRQGLPIFDRANAGAADGVRKGGYVMAEADGPARISLLATGSEVATAMEARDALQAEGIGTRVVNLACWELFEAQDADYRKRVLGDVPRVSIEAGATFGWRRWVGDDGATIGIDRFGASAPGNVVAEKLGINVDNLVATAKSVL